MDKLNNCWNSLKAKEDNGLIHANLRASHILTADDGGTIRYIPSLTFSVVSVLDESILFVPHPVIALG